MNNQKFTKKIIYFNKNEKNMIIEEFQKKYGLVTDGIIGKKTMLKIKEVLGIYNDYILAHFLGQCAHESGNFTTTVENLNYSAESLLKTFPKYFNKASALKYHRQSEKIANRVYANRMDNGNEESGDGWKYRGMGLIQLTGKANQSMFMSSVGIDDNTLIASEYAIQSAWWYFSTNNIIKWCTEPNNNSILNVSRCINLGNVNSKGIPNGLDDRIKKTLMYYDLLTD